MENKPTNQSAQEVKEMEMWDDIRAIIEGNADSDIVMNALQKDYFVQPKNILQSKSVNPPAQEVDVEKLKRMIWSLAYENNSEYGYNETIEELNRCLQSKAGVYSFSDMERVADKFFLLGASGRTSYEIKELDDFIQSLTSTTLQTKGREVMELFIEFEKGQKKTVRGGIEMYDVKGEYKYLTFSELFQLFLTTNPLNK